MPDNIIETQPVPETEPAPVEVPSPGPEDKPLGEKGLKALQEEREARKALEKQVAEFAPLLELAKSLRGAVPGEEPSDTEKLAAELEEFKAEAAKERLARLRLEVATAAELPVELAARLQGTSAEELKADAEALKALLPTQTTTDAPKGPRGDPAQGARPGGTSGGIQSGAAKYEARKKQGPTY
jgi:hypothetical protein